MPIITPKEGQSLPSTNQNSGSSARDRAIAALMGNSPNAKPPVPNASSVSVEEMGALQTSQNRQDDTSVTASETVESKPTPAPEKQSTEDKGLSSRYAQLARKEAALRKQAQAQEQALKAREAEMRAAIEAEVRSKLEGEYQSKYIPKDRFAQDAWAALQDAGLNYDEITKLALNPPQELHPTVKAQLQRLEAEIKATREQQETLRKQSEEAQTATYQQAIQQIRSDVSNLVKTSPDDYEAIRAYKQESEVVKLIEDTFNEDHILLTVEEAAAEVEKYLTENLENAFKLKKFQNRFKSESQSSAQEASANQKQESSQQQPAEKKPTLTNQVGTQRKLSARERAILAMRGELK